MKKVIKHKTIKIMSAGHYFVPPNQKKMLKLIKIVVVSTIILCILFVSFSYCGDCYFHISFLFLTSWLFKKSSCGDWKFTLQGWGFDFLYFHRALSYELHCWCRRRSRKKKAWVFSTTIRERDKKNAEYHSGDYQDKNGKCLN